MKRYNINFQIAPPNTHRWNSSEWDIRTCKNHFIAVFSTNNPYLPISEWDRLYFQCLITLNIIHNSRVNPSLLACAYLYEPYNFNKSPWHPLELVWFSMTNLTIAHHGAITAHHNGLLGHRLTISYACNYSIPKTVSFLSLIHCNAFQNYLLSKNHDQILSPTSH